VLVSVGLILNTGTGTLSSLGWQAIAAICPLGVLETALASKTIFPRALVVLGLTAILLTVFGKAFCAWLCPVAPIRSLQRLIKGRYRKNATRQGLTPTGGHDLLPDAGELAAKVATEATTEAADACVPATSRAGCSSCASSSCAARRSRWDSRHLILGGSLLSAAIFGFPVFCLVCPIGLSFATILILWQWLNLGSIGLSLLVYPAILIVELLVLRKWCAKLCPLGALLSLMSLPNRFFRPRVDTTKCLREQGMDCSVCCESCPEALDPHFADGMNECSKCGLCLENCPAQAISIPFKASKATQKSSRIQRSAD
jgi:ferredoxin-type protein NapH